MTKTLTLYSSVCFSMSSSSRVKFSSTDTARISWYAWQSNGIEQNQLYTEYNETVARHTIQNNFFGTELGSIVQSLHSRCTCTYLGLSGWHKFEDNMFEVLKVDFPWIIEVWGVGHGSVGSRGAQSGRWRWVWTNPLLFFCPAVWQLLSPFSFWLRL